MRRTLGLVGVSLLLVGCGSAPLAERDPAGAEACEKLAFALERENPTVYLGGLAGAGEIGLLADTPAIREAVIEVGNTGKGLADAEKLRKACIDEGEDMPPLREKDAS